MLHMKNDTRAYDFGVRLARARRQKGLTQQELADRIGASRRVVAYYEAETKYPPAHLIVPMSEALGISTDELLGAKTSGNNGSASSLKIQRRMRKIEQLPPSQQRFILKTIDSLLKAAEE